MPLERFHVLGYRSVRDLQLPMQQVNIVTGGNGTGKSNLYRALVLVARAADGGFARAVAEEGGTPSLLWAGGERLRLTRKKPPTRFSLTVETELFRFSFTVGLPPPPPPETAFGSDPEIREEKLWLRDGRSSILMLDRRGPSAWLRNTEGRMDEYGFSLLNYESVLSQIVEPHRYPELSAARQTLQSWRFYHQFRSDASSPLRLPQVGVQTPVISAEGSDVAAALQTILEVGDSKRLRQTVSEAFAEAQVHIDSSNGLFSIELQTPGLLRRLNARELSDGQIRFLCLCAALLSPRPPSLIALNEPETSLHPALYTPLAKLVAAASEHSQIWLTTHSAALAQEVSQHTRSAPIELVLKEGETWLASNPNSPRRPFAAGVTWQDEKEPSENDKEESGVALPENADQA